jgi:hypothetical protein
MRCRKKPARTIVLAAAVAGLLFAASSNVLAQAVYPTSTPVNTSKGLAAMDQAVRGDKYLFVFFWKTNDQNTQKNYGIFQTAMTGMADTADSIAVQIADANEKPIVDKFDVSRAPMPLVLALAPNGAVTKGWPVRFTEAQLKEGVVSHNTAACLKALQDKKLVLLCVQNEQTQFSQAAWQGVQAFKADARFAAATEIVAVDPRDQADAKLLSDLRVDPHTSQAVTVLLAPPGAPIAVFPGAVTKDQIVAKVAAAQSGPCANGKCGPGGCGPK